jgi:hypothetical protein
MKQSKCIGFIMIMLFFTSMVSAQVQFEAKASKTTLGVNERLRVDFEMNEDGDNFLPPSFEGFNVVGGPNQSVSHSWMNGVRSFNKTYSYFLQPKNQGNFTISQAEIEVEGVVYKTSPIKITVTKAIDIPKDPNDPDYIANNKIHVTANLSKTNPYLNEAITVEYRLYVAPRTGVSNWREVDNPEFNGFWSQNIDSNSREVFKGMYNGEEYRYVILRRSVLYPQKTGELKIEPLSLDVAIDVPSGQYDFFGRPLSRQVRKTISTGTKKVDVKALPLEGKPDNFTGAVGNFTFKTNTDKTTLDANESLNLTIEVTGNGNLKLFEIPGINLPSSLEVYEPEHGEKVNTYITGMQGKINDTYTIVPQFKGKYPLPSINFSYFDPKTETYKTLSSQEIVIDVINGPLATENTIVEENASPKSKNSQQEFLDIKTETSFADSEKTPFYKSTGFWNALLLPLIAIPLALIIRRKREDYLADVSGNKSRKANRLSRKYLGAAKRNLGDKVPFYLALEKALHNYLKAKLRIETSEMTKEKIEVILLEREVSEDTVSKFISILESCEQARYSPITDVTMQQDYEKAAETISAIDKEIK